MSEKIDVHHDYAICAWARHFNVSQQRVKEAVAAVGDSSVKVREHLRDSHPQGMHPGAERPSGR